MFLSCFHHKQFNTFRLATYKRMTENIQSSYEYYEKIKDTLPHTNCFPSVAICVKMWISLMNAEIICNYIHLSFTYLHSTYCISSLLPYVLLPLLMFLLKSPLLSSALLLCLPSLHSSSPPPVFWGGSISTPTFPHAAF